MRTTAADRLQRILHLLPLAARPGGAALDELSAALDVPARELLRDVETVTTRAYYHPAGSGDDIQIGVTGDRLTVWTAGEFGRPPKLTDRETVALALGLR
ncbi:MAG: hypothetical protein ACRELV_12845, partial [Longimicrobiales bacterium]